MIVTDFPVNNDIFIIDTSYVIYHNLNSCLAWYRYHFPLPTPIKPYDWSKDEEYMSMYSKKFLKSFNSVKEVFRIKSKNVFFALDCKRKNIWRKSYFKEYKLNRDVRDESKDVPNFGTVFNYTYESLMPSIKERWGSNLVGFDFAEADDVICVIKQHFRAKYPQSHIIICSNDNDFLQLIDDKTVIINLQHEVLNKKLEKEGLTLEQYMQRKFLIGDSGDNIPAVFKRCGKGTANKLLKNKDRLVEKFKKTPGSIEKYKLNKLLISFDNIPPEVKQGVLDSLSKQQPNILNESSVTNV